MPDYDPKSIPILDDVIEADILEQADAEDKHKAPIADITDMEDDLTVDDGTMNLFSTTPVELSTEDVINEDSTEDDSHIDELDSSDSGPSIGAIESLDTADKDDSSAYEEAETDEKHIDEEGHFESALTDYHNDTDVEEDTALATIEPADKAFITSGQTIPEIRESEGDLQSEVMERIQETSMEVSQATAKIDLDVLIDEVVDDIVNQLVPDLQQQLKHLVQQALEDRLPAEIIHPDKPANEANDT